MFQKCSRSKLFRATFFSYIAMLAIPIVVFSAISFRNNLEKQREAAR